jgi:D-alanyl-lipoteichoic acid acyltransferase DltB (MBOAT superfamily)
MKNGFLLMLWGYFEKVVIADRVAINVDTVFDNYQNYGSLQIIIAVILFAFQIYCDFAGYTHIAIGGAEVLGFRLMRNFNQPYFALNIRDFWQRWHISLSTWFRDYVYIPLGGNRCSRLKHQLNIMLVFIGSGIWHGAGWHYIFWGFLHGIYHVIGELTRPIKSKALKLFRINTAPFSYKILKIVITFALVDFAWIFFRAPSFTAALKIINKIIKFSLQDLQIRDLFPGLNEIEVAIALFSIIILLFSDLTHYIIQDFSFRRFLKKQNLYFRWVFYITAIMFILIFGIYGPEYNAKAFIYFQF